jgi:prolipoprotein diacylglyceryltransferase
MLDFLEEFRDHHAQAVFWYGVIFASGFGFGYIVAFLQSNPMPQIIQNALIWAVSGIFFFFISFEAARHMHKRR